MLRFPALTYEVLTPVIGLVLGSAIRVQEVERPSSESGLRDDAVERAEAPVGTVVDRRAVRDFAGRTPRSLRPAWQQRTLRALGL